LITWSKLLVDRRVFGMRTCDAVSSWCTRFESAGDFDMLAWGKVTGYSHAHIACTLALREEKCGMSLLASGAVNGLPECPESFFQLTRFIEIDAGVAQRCSLEYLLDST
jgi:hypothetical protein